MTTGRPAVGENDAYFYAALTYSVKTEEYNRTLPGNMGKHGEWIVLQPHRPYSNTFADSTLSQCKRMLLDYYEAQGADPPKDMTRRFFDTLNREIGRYSFEYQKTLLQKYKDENAAKGERRGGDTKDDAGRRHE